MLSPGAGEGRKAAAIQSLKAANATILHASLAFESGSKEQQAALRAVQALNTITGKAEGTNMVPAGIAAMAQANKNGPPSAAPPPGLTPSPVPGPEAGATPPEMAA